jgi:hypothetical protein
MIFVSQVDQFDNKQTDGAGGLASGGIFTRIEKWASESGDRANLLTILICVAFVLLVLAVVGGIALFTLVTGSAPTAPGPS